MYSVRWKWLADANIFTRLIRVFKTNHRYSFKPLPGMAPARRVVYLVNLRSVWRHYVRQQPRLPYRPKQRQIFKREGSFLRFPEVSWGNGRVFQSFWVLQNNSVVLKSLFCGIVWCEIQSYRKATCNFVVLTFIKKKLLHQGSNQGPSDQKPDALPDELLRLSWESSEFFGFLYLKLHKISTGMVLDLKIGGGGGQKNVGV